MTAKTIAPELAAHSDNIWLNKGLFDRVLVVYEQMDDLGFGGEQRRLLEETHKRFVRSGANLEDAAQERLREINAELAELGQQFQENLLNETNDFELVVTDRADLGSLPGSLVALAAEEAKRRGHDCECWVFTLQRPSINPFLQYSPNRELRKKMFDGYAMRGDNDNDSDNKAIVTRTVQLRAERAALMGYPTHAHYVLADNMAETPENAIGLLDQIWEAALLVAAAAVRVGRLADDVLQPPDQVEFRHRAASGLHRFVLAPGAGRAVEHGVDVGVPLLGSEAMGQVDTFVQHHAERELGAMQQFESADTQHHSLHFFELGSRSIEERFQRLVELGASATHQVESRTGAAHLETGGELRHPAHPLLGNRRLQQACQRGGIARRLARVVRADTAGHAHRQLPEIHDGGLSGAQF